MEFMGIDISIDEFNIDKDLLKIFDMSFYSLKDFIKNLEVYKVMRRESIINVINHKMEKVFLCKVDVVNRIPEFTFIEDRYDIIVSKEEGNTVTIVSDMFSDVEEELVLLDLSRYNVKHKRVTPTNYAELSNINSKIIYDLDILFKRILVGCLKYTGTDIHFTVKHINKIPHHLVEFRVNEWLEPFEQFKFDKSTHSDLIKYIISKKTKANVSDLDTQYGIVASVNDVFGDGEVELRVTANKCFGGYHCVIRIQKLSTTSKVIDELGFDKDTQEDLHKLSDKTSGLTLITGPQRSGKNTTAFSIANEMIKRPIKIIDYSSPIELLMPFTQIDYMSDPSYLVNCIRLCKKQDINVVFINEIPDAEVAKGIKDLINSSVHVVTTLHIDRLWHIPHKLFEYYGSSYKDIITQINGIVNQKMFIKQCKNCAEQTVSNNFKGDVREFLDKYNVPTLYTNTGCDMCNKGNHLENGLQPYVESLIFTDEIKTNLLKLNTPYEMEMYLKDYMLTRKKSLEFKLADAISKGNLNISNLRSIL